MPTNIADLFARLSLDTSVFKFGLAEAGQKVVEFTNTAKGATPALGGTTEAAKKLGDTIGDTASGPGKAFNSLLGNIKGSLTAALGPFAGIALAAGGVGVALGAVALTTIKSIGAFTEFATQVRDLSYLSGGSARDVSVLVSGMGELGVEAETVWAGLNKMSAAIEGGSPALNRLGVSTRTTSGSLKDGLTMFYETVDALGSMTNEVERNSLAREIFGRGWTSILPILREGSGAIKKMGEENQKFITEADKANLREYTLALKGFDDAIQKLLVNTGKTIIVPITAIIKWLTIGTGGSAAPTMTPEEAMREAFPGLYGKAPTQTLSSYFAEERGMQSNIAKYKMPEPENPVELEKRLKLTEQLATLDVARMTAEAYSEEDKLSAAIAKVNVEKQKTLNLIELEYKSGKLGAMGDAKTLKDKAALEVGTTKAATAAIEQIKLASLLKQSEAYIKFYDDEQTAAGKAFDVEVQINREITAGYLTEYQKRELEITDWEQKSIKSVLAVRGETLEANALIAKIYEEGTARRITLGVTEASAEEKRLQEMREKYFYFDDTIAEHQSATYIASQAEIDQARKEALERAKVDAADFVAGQKRNYDDDAAYAANQWILKTQVYTDESRKQIASQSILFTTIKSFYDKDVQDIINVNLLKTGLWENESRKQLDIEAGTYTAIEARRQDDIQKQIAINLKKWGLYQDDANTQLATEAGTYTAKEAKAQEYLKNLAIHYQIIAERDNSMWAAMMSGATTTYASLGGFWTNVSKGFADTFNNINKGLSDSFFDVMTGQFDKLGETAKNFGLSMVRTFADILAAEATKGLIDLIKGLGSALGGGGGWGGLLGLIGGGISSVFEGIGSFLGFLQGGLWEVPDLPGQEYAVLHPGEMVLPPGVAEQVRGQGGIYGFSQTAGGGGGGAATPMWPDASRGLPQPDIMYAQTLTPVNANDSAEYARWQAMYGSNPAYTVGVSGPLSAGTGGGGMSLANLLFGPGTQRSRLIEAMFASAGGGEGGPSAGGPPSAGEAIANAIGANLSTAAQAAFAAAHVANIALGFVRSVSSPLSIPAAFMTTVAGAQAIDSWGLQAAYGIDKAVADAVVGQLVGLSTIGLDAMSKAYGSLESAIAATIGSIADQMGISPGQQGSYGGSLGDWGEPGAYGGWGEPGGGWDTGTSGEGFGGDGRGETGGQGESGNAGMWASGGLFDTRGPTRMIVGEAGTETVAVLRNPQEAGGGGQTITITVPITNHGIIGNAKLSNEVARAVLAALRSQGVAMPNTNLLPTRR